MLHSRRSRSRRAGNAAARRSGDGASWRPGRGGGGRGAGAVVLVLIAAALVGVGYGWGRWSANRARTATGAALPVARGGDAAAVGAFATTERTGAAMEGSSEVASLDLEPSDPSLPANDALAGSDAPRASESASAVSIVIDDLGRSVEVIDQLRGFGVPLTYAVLPFESRTAEVAARLGELGEEILCHLPMQAQHGVDPGPGALDGAMNAEEIRASTRRALAAVPGAIGVNNHMGSALSEDPVAMAAMLDEVAAAHIFFLDSRTSAASVAYRLARERGLPAAERKVFFDADRTPSVIRDEFRRLLALASAGGPAIAIGHPYPETLAVLAEEIPRAQALGYRFVRVSEVVLRDGDRRQPRSE